MNLLAKKPLSRLLEESEGEGEKGCSLKRTLSATALVALGVGAIIGAGIFTLTGVAASTHAGPALVYSFILAAVGCAFAGFCYSEFSTMIPIAGKRLHLRLRNLRRTGSLDYRLGADSGIRRRSCNCRGELVGYPCLHPGRLQY